MIHHAIARSRRQACLAALPLLIFAMPAVTSTFQTTIQAQGTQGDLVVVMREGKPVPLRLFGVACPVAGQPMAELATTHILEAAMDTAVTVEIAGEDAAGTPVAWIKLPDGVSLNEQLVRQGLAWWDQPNAPEVKTLQQASRESMKARRGIWAGETQLAPWDYRTSRGLETIRYKKPESAPAESGTRTIRPAMPAPTPAPKAAESADKVYFPTEPEEHMALMLKHQPRIAYDVAGKPVGLTATDIASVPGASQFGLQNDDVVESVNGIALTSEAQVLGLVTQLQGAKQLELQVIRKGKRMPIVIPLD